MRQLVFVVVGLLLLSWSGVAGAQAVCVGGAPNGVVEGVEECDDDNPVNGDGCDNNCTTTRCGNSQVVPPETCDDGNTMDEDFCPADCQVEFCEPTDTEVTVHLDLTSPDVAAITLFLDYPEGAVDLLGTGTGVPAERVAGPPFGTIQANDFDHAMRLVIFDLFNFGTTRVATLRLDACAGAAVPDPSLFECRVEGNATDETLTVVPGVACTVTVVGGGTTTTTTVPTTTTLPGATTTTTVTTSTTTTTVPCDTVTCLSRNALADPACAGATVPAPLVKKLQQAGTAAEQATAATGKKQKKLQKKVKAALAVAKRNAKRFARGKRPKLEPACGAAIDAAIGAAQGALAAGRF